MRTARRSALATRGPAPFSEDRFTRAADLFATYFRREASGLDILRSVILDSRMRPTDYLVGKRLGPSQRSMVRVTGVICEGFSIVDASDGKPDFAMPYGQATIQAIHQF